MHKIQYCKKVVCFTFIFSLLVLAACTSSTPVAQKEPLDFDGQLTVHYLDVGQADAVLIQLPDGENMLIDAGNNPDGPLITAYLQNQGIDTIHYLIGTHPHEDHIGALDDIIQNFNIETFYMPKVTHNTKTFEDVLLAADEKGLQIHTAKAGVTLFEQQGLNAVFIAPNSENYSQLNDYSAVIRLVYGDTAFLFTGDAESLSEKEMLENGAVLQADVLKVGHHGSDTSSSDDFLSAVAPNYAVISCGDGNSYGHPTPSILEKFQEQQIVVYRTDLQGTIVAKSDGVNISFPDTTTTTSPQPLAEEEPAPQQEITVDETLEAATNTSGNAPAEEPQTGSPQEETQKETAPVTVYIADSGTKYHTEDCSYLNKSKIAIVLPDALSQGYTPCSRCNPPE